MSECHVGTSGWTYKHWRNKFYPENLSAAKYLAFYSQRFSTAEVNYSFYRLPLASTYQKWANTVDDSFVFAVKASRFISHVKRLNECGQAWSKFTENAKTLGSKLGPILVQLPENFSSDPDRLSAFLSDVKSGEDGIRIAFEFRHESWFNREVYRILETHGAALVAADSPRYPRFDIQTTDFMYFRFHGRTSLFASKYSLVEMAEEAKKIRNYLKDGTDVYAYFNNDGNAHAVINARQLSDLISGEERKYKRSS